jgi:phosphate ABC transporter phosphate-binding protein
VRVKRLLALVVLSVWAAGAQSVTRIYVEPLEKPEASVVKLRETLVETASKEKDVNVVARAEDADRVLSMAGETYIKGYVGRNIRLRYKNQDSVPVYGGYLSLELKTKTDQPVWSYLVTPRRFGSDDISKNLAEQAVKKLVEYLANAPPESTSPQQNSPRVLLGAGATFPYPLYKKWFATFQKGFPGLSIGYRSVGSGAGLDALSKGDVDFAASDIPLTDAEMASYPVKIQHIPSVVGGVVLIYRLDGFPRELRLTPEALAGIYSGKITRWNDRLLRAANRDFELPDREIVVVHRSDRSGTTYIWTSYLSSVSEEWKSSAGAGATVKWPTGLSTEGTEGVAELVAKTPNSIGYVEFFYALAHRLNYASIRNRSGQFVPADLTTLPAAALEAAASSPDDLRISIVNASGKNAYPIAAFTYLLVPAAFKDATEGSAMKQFLAWMLDTGQKQCGALGYAALPAPIDALAKKAAERIQTAP